MAEGEEDITINMQCGLLGRLSVHQRFSMFMFMPFYPAACHTNPVLTPDHCPQVSDEGGGIPRSGLPKMWTYLYTTAK